MTRPKKSAQVPAPALDPAAQAAAMGVAARLAKQSPLANLHSELAGFKDFGTTTQQDLLPLGDAFILVYQNEYWTAKQRAGHSLHEVSYRACYKPQLPEFFIKRFTKPGDVVYDPFLGRGTTLIEAAMHGRSVVGNDVNPLSAVLTRPRLAPPTLAEIESRLQTIPLSHDHAISDDDELLVFYERKTLSELLSWRIYFRERKDQGTFDTLDEWLQMVACNRMTGHSPGFFSVYTLPPNQATSVVAQRKINAKRNQVPEYRDTKKIIFKKSKNLLGDPLPATFTPIAQPTLLTRSAAHTPEIADDSIDLLVTSPPFINVVDYVGDNWLRLWFAELQTNKDDVWQMSSLDKWFECISAAFVEFHRIMKPKGIIAFEVGEVRKGSLPLEKQVVECALAAGFKAEAVMVNSQVFTKTANCWGVKNNEDGTNTNRIVVLTKVLGEGTRDKE